MAQMSTATNLFPVLGAKRGPQIEEKFKKSVPEFAVFLEGSRRVFLLVFPVSGSKKVPKSDEKRDQNRVQRPTHRLVADMLNLSCLAVFSRGRASKKSGENQEKRSKSEEENADRKKKALRGRFLLIFVFLGLSLIHI